MSVDVHSKENDVVKLSDEMFHKQIGNVLGNMKHGIICNRIQNGAC